MKTELLVRYDDRYESIDLYSDVDMPLNYTIFDVREPDKRKTNFSKTLTIPGTKNNSIVFNHVYEIGGSSKFNPNKRTDVIIQQNGIQIIRGNLQLKNIIRRNDTQIDYEFLITGDFTSLFSDIGIAKLSDLDLSEWEHVWNADNIEKSWDGIVKLNGNDVSNVTLGLPRLFNSVNIQPSTGRVSITTTALNGFNVGDTIRITPNPSNDDEIRLAEFIYGDYIVAEVISGTNFTINHPFPPSLLGNTLSGNVRTIKCNGNGYVYGLVSWGDDIIQNINGADIQRFPIDSMVPSFFVKTIWDKIFQTTDSKYKSNFLNSDFFNRLTLTNKRTVYEIPQEQLIEREFKVANQLPYNLTLAGFGSNNSGTTPEGYRNFPTGKLSRFPFPSDIESNAGILVNGVPGNRPFNQSTNIWTVNETGKYNAQFNISLFVEASISDFTVAGDNIPPDPSLETIPGSGYFFRGGYPNGLPSPIENDLKIKATIYKETDGTQTILNEQIVSLIRTSSGSLEVVEKKTFKDWVFPTKDIIVGFTELKLFQGDKIWVTVEYECFFNNDLFGLFTEVEYIPPSGGSGPQLLRTPYRGTLTLRDIGVEYFFNTPINTISEGDKIIPSVFVPKDMLCRDFIIGVIRAFNLYVDSDRDIEKLYTIEPRDDYYRDGSAGVGDYVDWTGKVDVNSIQIIPMGELTAKYYNFTYRDDSDYWNRRYKDDVGETYGSYVRTVDNDFLQNEVRIELPFTPAPMINTPRYSDIIIPQIVSRDERGINKPINAGVKLLYWSGLKPTSNLVRRFWLLESFSKTQDLLKTQYTYYPFIGSVDSPYDPYYDLNFFYTRYVYWDRARWTNYNLYNAFWKSFIEEIVDIDSKVIIADLRLDPMDIYNLDFRKIYVINGNYLRLQKVIDYSANGSYLTQCEFLKLKAPSKFRRRSVGVGDIIEVSADSGRMIPTDTIQRGPSTFTDRNIISNWSGGDLSGNISNRVSGQNNIIERGASNISITGDENYVGSRSNNISISGNAVFVSGGISNVNVIGTNKLFIDNSDVTYINGVRYQNGVSVSKASVIDGGLNIVSKRSSTNTSPTVIDATEDNVIDFNSTTPENIINGGEDRILPDVPNFGLSTFTSPNPINNPLGEAIRDVGGTLQERIINFVDPIGYTDS